MLERVWYSCRGIVSSGGRGETEGGVGRLRGAGDGNDCIEWREDIGRFSGT